MEKRARETKVRNKREQEGADSMEAIQGVEICQYAFPPNVERVQNWRSYDQSSKLQPLSAY